MDMVDASVRAADRAFRAQNSVDPRTRQMWMHAIADGVEANRSELVDLADAESHLGRTRLEGELTRTIFQLRLLGDEAASGIHTGAIIDHADAAWGMGPRPDLRSSLRPIGVVGVFGASNFPFAFSVIGGDSASALAAGCAVVHKAHPAHAVLARRTARVVREALDEAGAPEGLFSLVEGHDEGVRLVQHPLVRAVAFTGSTRAGRALFDLAAARPEPIPFHGELGSTNPVFVTETAWRSRAAEIVVGFLDSVSLGRGQFCTKPGFLIAPEGAAEAIAEAGRSRAPLGGVMLTPALREGYESALTAFSSEHAADVVLGGASAAEEPPLTILRLSADAVLAKPELLEQEMFGPGSVVVEYRDADRMNDIAPLIGGQLTTTVHAEDSDDVAALLDVLAEHSGRILWNGWPTGVSVTFAQNHGGPYPATTTGTTSVGVMAISRFQRRVAYQGVPVRFLPSELRDDASGGVRRIDGELVLAEEER